MNKTNDILDRSPPSSIESEECLVGSVILDPSILYQVISETGIKPEHFHCPNCATIWTWVGKIYEERHTVDHVILMDAMREAGELESAGGAAFIGRVVTKVPNAAHGVYYASQVVAVWRHRSLIERLTTALMDAYDSDNVNEITDELQGDLVSLRAVSSEKPERMTDVLHQVLDDLENEDSVRSFSTGFPTLDETIKFRPGELTVLAARPGEGKTTLAGDIMMRIGEERNVLFLSCEMDKGELVQRCLANLTSINGHKFLDGGLSVEERKKVVSAANKLSGMRCMIMDTVTNWRALLAHSYAQHAAMSAKGNGLDLVILDYLQFVAQGKPQYRHAEIGEICLAFKSLARKCGCAVLLVAMLSRDAKRGEGEPKLHHLKDSGEIEQHADNVVFIHTPESIVTEGMVVQAKCSVLLVAKQRKGPTGSVDVFFEKKFSRFREPDVESSLF